MSDEAGSHRCNPFNRSPSENEDFRFESDQPADAGNELPLDIAEEAVVLELAAAGIDSTEAAENRLNPPANYEVARPDNDEEALSLASTSRNTSARGGRIEKADYGSIVIPVCGTLSRPIRKKTTSSKNEGSYKQSIRERVATTYLKEDLADVYFVFETPAGTERVPAHSYVLSVSSTVFNAQFGGNFKRETEISVVDVDCEAFKVMLRYIYTDEVVLSMDNALSVLYTAKRYLVEHLIDATLQFLASSLNAQNVCAFLAQSKLFDDNGLMQNCHLVLDAQAEVVLRSEGFKELDLEQVKSVISRDTLNVSEMTVFEALMEWSKEECARKGLDATSSNIRGILGETFLELRFPTMNVEDFANGPAMSNMLTPEETSTVFLRLTAKEKPSTPFVSRPRIGLPRYTCHRFHTSASRINQWRYRGHCDAIQFSVDRRIFLSGIGLYGSSNGSCEYAVRLELKWKGDVVNSVSTSFKSDGSSKMFSAFWENPIQIEADALYTISVTIEGRKLSYFGQEGLPEVQVPVGDGVVTFSFESSVESKNGTGVQGGQIPDLIFYA